MQIKCGIDIIEIARVKEAIANTQEKFIERIFTKREIEYCESKKSMKYQHYAARFAAKEAIFKALSDGLKSSYEIGWKDIEIQNSKEGRPMVYLQNLQTSLIEQCDISLSHCKEYAVANAVIIMKD